MDFADRAELEDVFDVEHWGSILAGTKLASMNTYREPIRPRPWRLSTAALQMVRLVPLWCCCSERRRPATRGELRVSNVVQGAPVLKNQTTPLLRIDRSSTRRFPIFVHTPAGFGKDGFGHLPLLVGRVCHGPNERCHRMRSQI